MAGGKRSLSLVAFPKPGLAIRCGGGGPIRDTPESFSSRDIYSSVFVERLVEFFLLLLGGRLLIWRHVSCFWLAVADWRLT